MRCPLLWLLLVLWPWTSCGTTSGVLEAPQRPNIVYILADDLGYGDVSCLNPNAAWKTVHMDRLAAEGMTFTDYYGEQSCTAGRSSFIMGQSVFRTGLSKVGLPGLYNHRWLPFNGLRFMVYEK